jgi:hypothetical protein
MHNVIKYQITHIGMLFDTLGFVFSSIGVMILSLKHAWCSSADAALRRLMITPLT